MKLFLDASAVIEVLRGNQDAKAIMEGADALYSSVLCAYEVLRGEQHSQIKGLKSYYVNASLLFARIDTLPVTYGDILNASDLSARLISKGKKVDDIDIIIAVQALSREASILTRDARHFKVLKEEGKFSVELL